MLGAVKMKILLTESFLSSRKIMRLQILSFGENLLLGFLKKITFNIIKWLKTGKCLPPFSLPIASNSQVSVEPCRAVDREKRRGGDFELKKG